MTTDSTWVQATTLQGADVTLVPLASSHAESLLAAATPETFRYFSHGPEPWTVQGMVDFIEFLHGPAATVAFCVMHEGAPSGITTYLDIKPAHRGLEIGWTWLTPSLRGTRANPAMKRLMLAHAFDELGAIRVCLKTDERNAHSRAAILKLGAQFEGILREAVIMPDGFHRSSAMYSILAGEWPHVRAGLDARLS